jgi:hypothetical protein
MTRFVTLWRAAALGLIAVLAVVNLIHAAKKSPPSPPTGVSTATDIVTTQEKRFARLGRVVIERGLSGTIGYFGDLPRERFTSDPREVQEFYLAQYVLVPLVLDLEAERHEWAVGNLSAVTVGERLLTGWKVEEDCGDGVLLLKRVRP